MGRTRESPAWLPQTSCKANCRGNQLPIYKIPQPPAQNDSQYNQLLLRFQACSGRKVCYTAHDKWASVSVYRYIIYIYILENICIIASVSGGQTTPSQYKNHQEAIKCSIEYTLPPLTSSLGSSASFSGSLMDLAPLTESPEQLLSRPGTMI